MANKSERIIVRLTKEELEDLQKIAVLEDKSVSEVIRGLIKFRSNHYSKNQLNIPIAKAEKTKKDNSIYDVDWLNKEPTNEELYEMLKAKIN